jgi:transcriptional regulator GlxA family with amidase domain
MVAFPDAQVLDVVGPLEVFSRTARLLESEGRTRRPAYAVEIVADRAGPVAMSSGVEVVAARAWRDVRRADTLLVAGGIGYAAQLENPSLLAWLRRQRTRVRRLGSICTGALILGRAGLLEGGAATTHWAYCEQLAESCPDTAVEPDAIFVRHGNVYTSAGVTAGMDLALALVEEDWGRSVALAVAQQLVLFLKRPGGQSQFSSFLSAQATGTERFRDLQTWILEHLDEDLSVPALAERMAMSERHFSRAFAAEVGQTPASFVRAARLEAARRLLEESNHHVDQVAWRCGYGSEETMRRAFLRTLKITPGDYRARFQ